MDSFTGHTDSITCLDVDWTARRALSGSSDHSLKIWDLDTTKCTQTLSTIWTCSRWRDVLTALSAKMDWASQRALCGMQNGYLKLFDLSTGSDKTLIRPGHRHAIHALDVDWGRQRAIAGSDSMMLMLWDLESFKCIRTFEGHSSSVSSACLDCEGSRVVSASHDGTLKLWCLEDGSCTLTLNAHAGDCGRICVAVDWSSFCAVSGARDGWGVWDLSEGTCIRQPNAQDGTVTCVALSSSKARVTPLASYESASHDAVDSGSDDMSFKL